MRCMACGAEMVLMNVVEDNTISVSGFEHHTFMCSECHDTERRLMFARHAHEGDAAPTLEHPEPPISGGERDPELVPELTAPPSSGRPSDTAPMSEHPEPPISGGESDPDPVPELTAPPASRWPSATEPVPELAALAVFIGQIDTEPMPVLFTTPSTAPASAVQDGRVAAVGFFRNALAKIRGR